MAHDNLLQKLFRNQTNKTWVQFLRYILVGGIVFIIDFGSLFILTEVFGIYYLISAALAFTLGLIANYFLSISWVFNIRILTKKHFEFGVFALIGIIGLFFNEVLIWVLTEDQGINYLISKIFTSILILFWNFYARKFILFR
jgi:putative flippase GtrA